MCVCTVRHESYRPDQECVTGRMDMSGMEQAGQAAAGGYMNRWYDGSEGGHAGLHQDYYNSMAQAMHCAYGNNMAGTCFISIPIHIHPNQPNTRLHVGYNIHQYTHLFLFYFPTHLL